MWWLAGWVGWTLLALMSASQTALFLAYRGEHVVWAPLLVARLVDWYTCALFTPAFVWLARRYPLERHTWVRNAPVQLGASVIAVLAKYAAFLPISRALYQTRATLPGLLAANIFTELMFFWAMIAVIHAVEFYRRYRAREAYALGLAAQLSRAQLDALRAQLQPHFLFNTLNAIATLIHSNADAADRMLMRLSDLLRSSLQLRATDECTLSEEVSLAHRYVEIMRSRFGDRVSVTWDIPRALERARVPAFTLQPLIENAFEHGANRDDGNTQIVIGAARDGGALRMYVRDNGPGVSSQAIDDGIGLTNTRSRLTTLYGSQSSLTIQPGEAGGTSVTVSLPYHEHHE